jgi:hypothetical protein
MIKDGRLPGAGLPTVQPHSCACATALSTGNLIGWGGITEAYVRIGNRTYEGVMALVIGNRKVLLSAPYKFRQQDLA